MILKKPYAFLIKNFRIIHIILSVIIAFIILKFNKISVFFNAYIKGEIKNSIGLADIYIDTLIYFAIIVVIVFAVLMIWLMQKKHKPILFYLLTFFFYLILLVAIFIASGVMTSLEEGVLTQQMSRAYRDTFFVLLFLQYYFVIQSIIRGLGFDVKKFNFNKDLVELEIKDEDSEEFEFVLGTDIYLYERKLRRSMRELKYYLLENKLIVSIVIGVLSLLGIIYVFMNANFINKVYGSGKSVNLAGFTYKINASYATIYDYKGLLIKKNKQYIIVNMSVTNNSSQTKPIENYAVYLTDGNTNVYNQPSLRNYFIDMGQAYVGEPISANATKNLIFIFELDNNENYRNFKLKVYKEQIINEDRSTEYIYVDFKLKTKELKKAATLVERKKNEILYLGQTLFRDANVIINKTELTSKYEYQYEICKNNKCETYYDIISPTNPLNQKLLVIDYQLQMPQDISIIETMNNDKFFFDKFLQIEYNYNGKNYSKVLNTKTFPGLKGKVFVDIPTITISNELFNLMIKTRDYHYYINLLE